MHAGEALAHMQEEFTPRIYGKYYLIDRIAVGGMAEIYAAKTFSTAGFAKTLVIKRILSRFSENKSFVSMFIDEAKISVSLQHSNIVQVYDFGRIKDNYYLAMEWVDGRDSKRLFNKLLARRELMNQEHAVFLAHEACKALDYAHRLKNYKGHPLNIVHQDISPSNLVISFNGECKVVDFGIAKTSAFANDVKDGINWGKVSYVSPERLQHQPPTPQSDIFSVGVVLWECLTGRTLFKDKDPKVSARKILSGDYPAPSIYNPAVPAALDLIVLRALAREPTDRFADANEMQEILYDFLGNRNPSNVQKKFASYMRELFDDERKIQHARMERGSRMAQEFHESLGDIFEVEGGSSGSVPMSPDLLDALGLDPDLGSGGKDEGTRPSPSMDRPLPEDGSDGLSKVNLRHALRAEAEPGTPLPDLRPSKEKPDRLERIRRKGGGPDVFRPPRKEFSSEPETEEAALDDTPEFGQAAWEAPKPRKAAHVHGVRRERFADPEAPRGPGLRLALGVAIAALAAACVLILIGRPGGGDTMPGALEVREIKAANPGAKDVDGSRRSEGWARLRKGTMPDIVAARTALERSVAYNSEDANSLAGLALAYSMLSTREPELAHDAIELLRRARTIDPDQPALLRAQAGMDIAFDNPQKAIEDARACLVELPADTFCTLYLGLGQLGVGMLDEGRATLLDLSDELPNAGQLWVGLADAEAEAGQLAQAESRLEAYRERVPDDPRAHTSLARLYRIVGNYRAARDHSALANDLDPLAVEPRLIQGTIELHVEGDVEEAWDLLGALSEDKIVGRHPLEAEILVQASNAAFAAGEVLGARALAEQALQAEPGWAPAAFALARARATEDVGAAFEALQSVNTNDLEGRQKARYHYGAGILLRQDGRFRSAQTEFETALAVDPAWLDAREALVTVLLDLDDWAKAVEIAEQGWQFDLARERARDRIVLIVAPSVEHAEVLAAIDRAEQRNPEHARDARRLRGMVIAGHCIQDQGCRNEVPRVQGALADSSGASLAYVGRTYLANERWQAALVHLGRIPLAERNGFVDGLEGFAHEGLGRTASADAAMEKAYSNTDGTADGLHRRHALLLMNRPDRAGALSESRLAYSLDPADMVSAAMLLTYGEVDE